jgi:hypothetical protein
LFYFEHHEQDQYKNIASIYGKTLWALKNDINLEFILNKIKAHPLLVFIMCKAINDFNTDVWKEEREKSHYLKIYNGYVDILNEEWQEVVQ